VQNGVVVDIGSMKAFVLGVLAVEGIGKGVGQESIGDA
jgi:hypothetical protein